MPAGTTTHGSGKNTAPGAGAVLASINHTTGPLPKGRYLVEIYASVSAGSDTGNVEYREGATAILSGLGEIAGDAVPIVRELDGNTDISLNATAAGGAGVVYGCQLVVSRLM